MLILIHKCDRILARIEYLLLMISFSSITLILCAQVIMRYFFSNPIFWAEEVSVQILIFSTFLGLSYLTYLDKLVRVDVILENLSLPMIKFFKRLIGIVSVITIVFIIFYATNWLMKPENQFNVSPTTGILKWYNYLSLVICFYLMLTHIIVKVIDPLTNKDNDKISEE